MVLNSLGPDQARQNAKALDKTHIETISLSEPLVQIQINFTELFFMMPYSKIAQMVSLH